MTELDPITLEMFWRRFNSTVDELAATLKRTSFSTVVRDVNDYAAAIFDREVRLLAQSPESTPGLCGPLGNMLRCMLEDHPPETLEDGDALIGNNPWQGSGHHNDITVATPVFHTGRIIGYTVTCCHHVDIGGRRATIESRDNYEEGLRIPNLKIFKAGELNTDVLAFITNNVRSSETVVGDLRAQFAANHVGAERLRGICAERDWDDLQMVADEQTHLLPKEADELAAIACFMGYDDVEDLSRDVKFHLSRVETHYADLFEDSPELAGTGGNLVFTGTEDDPDTLQTLRSLGFSDGHAVSATVRGWHHGRIRATRSPRARELLTELMPGLLGAFSQTVSPDAAFRRFDEFLSNLPAGVQLFSMFYARPGLLDSLAEIMGSAPSLAEHLSRHPTLLDGVLTGRFYEPVGEVGELTENLGDSLAQAADFQDLLDAARRWTHDREFQIGMQLLRGMISGEDAGVALSDVAEANLNCLLPHVRKSFAARTAPCRAANSSSLASASSAGGR